MLFHARNIKSFRIASDGEDELVVGNLKSLTRFIITFASYLDLSGVIVMVLVPGLYIEMSPVRDGLLYSDGLVCEVDVVGPSLHKFHIWCPSRPDRLDCGSKLKCADAGAVEKRRKDEIGSRRDDQGLVLRRKLLGKSVA